MPPRELLCCGLLAAAPRAGFAEDRCNWRGSSLSQEPGSVRQPALACAEGVIEWLYPAGALRLTLDGTDLCPRPCVAAFASRCARPATGAAFAGPQPGPGRTSNQSPGPQSCTAPTPTPATLAAPLCHRHFRDTTCAHVTQLCKSVPDTLAPGEGASWPCQPGTAPRPEPVNTTQSMEVSAAVTCCGSDPSPSRLVPGEGWGCRGPGVGRGCVHGGPRLPGACRPCSDADLLLAMRTSDFLVRGTIQGITHDTEPQESVIEVAVAQILCPTPPLLRVGSTKGPLQASTCAPLHCGVRPRPGTFLFMGWSGFGQAWPGCAPHAWEFRHVYAATRTAHLHPCEVALG
ncbi:meteorin [Tamandua tetradactyla]|uniref:meteorin n=1 Tax=Tamandua tetradactyla TaxID=48850 RepID=UPI004054941F